MPTPTPTTTGLSLRQLAEREERVFPSYPQVAKYFPAASIEEARQRLARAIDRGDGPGLVIGGPGTGKSLLLQVLAAQYHERFDVVLPACARLCTRRALLQSILFELGLPYKSRDEGELRLSLLDHLLSREDCPTGLLLLVDEAQTLSIALLDELRVLTNLVRGGLPRVRLILAGSSALEESFANPELESFSQRLAARCYLAPFGCEESAQFVRAQISAAGASPGEIFAADAWAAIFEATDGVPRLVNQLCDRALVEAGARGRTRIDRQTIQAAWADIQQLPTPWDTPAPESAPAASPQVVEFGNLASDRAGDHVATDELLLYDESWNDEPTPNAELTELDLPDESEAYSEADVARPVEPSPIVIQSKDPFAEKFDEDEVVLDNFAAWDDMFRREAPRVQNRRDPEFATLVQAAIATTDAGKKDVDTKTSPPLRKLEPSVVQIDDITVEPLVADPPGEQETANWPPLRLAIVSDAGPRPPTPKFTTTDDRPSSIARAYGQVEHGDTSDWSCNDLSSTNITIDDVDMVDEAPVLIIEDEPTTLTPPVRREQYRHLFSRLRSG